MLFRSIIQGLGLDRYPQLIGDYFGHYKRIVYLAQTPDAMLERKAAKAAERLGLSLVIRHTGISGIETFLAAHTDAGADLPSGGRTYG